MTEIVNKDAIEKRDSKPIKDRSRFNNSYRLAGTYRFGEYAPTMVADCVPDDNHKIKVSHVVKSYTMKQPLMQDIQLKDDTFLTPLSALLPRNYEKFITSPNIGDDVNSELVGTSVIGFTDLIFGYLGKLLEVPWLTSDPDDPDANFLFDTKTRFELALKYVVCLDNLLSSGSLCSALGMPLVGNSKFVDKAINDFFLLIDKFGTTSSFKANVKINGVNYDLSPVTLPASSSSRFLTLREFWNRIHDTADWSFNSLTDTDNLIDDLLDNEADLWDSLSVGRLLVPDELAPFDLARFYAYQINCAHFYSNDKVDYIYSAELWRQNLRSFFLASYAEETAGLVNNTFSWNGVACFYDETSAYFVHEFLSQFSVIVYDTPKTALKRLVNDFVDWVSLIFAYRRSLRFVDYFTGSRTRPLAPGDANVTVSGGKIDVVQTIQTKWFIRLWSQISRIGHKLSEQMQGLFPGVQPSVDWHDPIWLSHNEGKVMASEVDNTGANQFDEKTPIAVTSTLHGGSHGNSLNLNINDRYAIVMTISYFDISRFYTRAVDRDIFHVSRYDKFNPFLQFMGDQKLLLKELDTDAFYSNIFAYQGRYMEYKQRIDRAFGGLSNPEVLPGMLFLADFGRSQGVLKNISPDYIRSYPCELDRFFIALSGWSLGTYFHFIMVTTDEIDSSRPMAYNPQIQ